MRKIVIINQSTGELCRDIANAFCKRGFETSIICGKKCVGSIKEKLDDNISIETIISYDKSSSFRRLKTWMLGSAQIFFKVLFNFRKHDLLIVSNPPFATLLPLLLHNPYSLLIYDIFPDVLCTQKVLSEKSLFLRLWKRMNKKVYKNAKSIFTIGNRMKKVLEQYAPADRIIVIDNWTDTTFIMPIPKSENSFIRQNGLQNQFIVLYSGNFGNTHKVEAVLDIAKRLQSIPEISFVIIGDGNKKQLLKDTIENEGLTNSLLLPYQPYDVLPYSLTSSDISVITLDENSSSMSVPSKTYTTLASGAAVLGIASQETDFAELVNQYNVGKCFYSSDIDGMTDFVVSLYRNPELLETYKRNSRSAAFDFTPQNAYKYVESYQNETANG